MTDGVSTGGVRVSMRDIFEEVQRQGRLLDKIANTLPDTENDDKWSNGGSPDG